MMTRLLVSLLIGLALGAGLGLLLGWELFPVEYVDSPLSLLDPEYKEAYTVMIAYGYVADRDLEGAVERLQRLNVTNVAGYVQDLAERYITQSRSIDDTRYLVALAEAMGRFTDLMQPYQLLPTPVQ